MISFLCYPFVIDIHNLLLPICIRAVGQPMNFGFLLWPHLTTALMITQACLQRLQTSALQHSSLQVLPDQAWGIRNAHEEAGTTLKRSHKVSDSTLGSACRYVPSEHLSYTCLFRAIHRFCIIRDKRVSPLRRQYQPQIWLVMPPPGLGIVSVARGPPGAFLLFSTNHSFTAPPMFLR